MRRDSRGFEPYVRGQYAGKSVFHTARLLAQVIGGMEKRIFQHAWSLARVTERYGKRIFHHNDRVHRPSRGPM